MKKSKGIIPMLIVIILILAITGFRFTALSAAKSNSFVSRDFELIEKYDTGSSEIFLFKSDDKELYRTVLSEKSGLFYRSSTTTYLPYRSDSLQTIGGLSYKSDSEAFSFISIQSNDDEVAFIEAGEDINLQRKEISKGKHIYFLFPFGKQIDHLNATAYNKDGKKLYYYGYPKATNIFNVEDLMWHKVDVK